MQTQVYRVSSMWEARALVKDVSKMCQRKKKKTNNLRSQKSIHTVGTGLTDDYQLYRIRMWDMSICLTTC